MVAPSGLHCTAGTIVRIAEEYAVRFKTITGRVFAERFRRPSTSRAIHICKIYDVIAYFARYRIQS